MEDKTPLLLAIGFCLLATFGILILAALILKKIGKSKKERYSVKKYRSCTGALRRERTGSSSKLEVRIEGDGMETL